MKRWGKAIVIFLLVFGFLIRSFFILKGPEFLINWWILIDDSFYSLKIAKNFADGMGLSVDGIHPTNGIQPLYLLILLPIFYLIRQNLFTPITIAISITSIFNLFTGYFIYRIVKGISNFSAGVFSLFLWCFSMTVINLGINGLETSIASFFIVLTSFYYLKYIRGNPKISLKNFLTLGIFLGLSGLARLDGIFFILALFIDFLIFNKEKNNKEIYSYLIAGVLIFPWLLMGFIRMGTIIPISGQAARLIALTNGIRPYFTMPTSPPIFFPIESPPTKFYLLHILGSLHIFKIFSFFLYPLVSLRVLLFKLSSLLSISFLKIQLIAGITGTAILIFIVFKKWDSISKKIGEFLKQVKVLNFMLYFALLLFINYSFYVFGMWHYPRYYFPVCAIAAIYSGLFFDFIFVKILKDALAINKKILNILIIIIYLYFSYFFIFEKNMDNFYGLKTYLKPHDFRLFYYETALWINKNIPKGERIGVFESGIIGYFCKDHIVINLDGVQNKDALEACRNMRMLSYVKSERIKYIVGQEVLILNQLWRRSSREEQASANLEYITKTGDISGLRMNIYRVKYP